MLYSFLLPLQFIGSCIGKNFKSGLIISNLSEVHKMCAWETLKNVNTR
jgi:hypothetical protein